MMGLKMKGTYDSVADFYHSSDVPVVDEVWAFTLICAPMGDHAAISIGLEVVDLITGRTVTSWTVHELVG